MSLANEMSYEREHAVDADLLRLLRDAAAGFSRPDGIKRARALRFEKPGIDRKAWESMANDGWLGILVAQADGGQSLGFSAIRVLAEELQRSVNPEPLTAVAVLTALTVAGCPASPLRSKLLEGIVSGKLIVATAYQDAEGSLNVETPGVTLSDRGSLSGEARHVFPALGADGFVVAARQSAGIVLVYVEADAKGLSIAAELRADGSYSGRVTFKDVVAGKDAILASGKQAIETLSNAISAATLVTAAELFGLMERALEITIEYLKTRVQFGKPIGSFQALQHRTVDLWIQKELSRGALNDAISIFDGDGDSHAKRFAASRAKSRCGDAALLIGRESIKLHGAIGYTDEYDVGLYLRRAMTLAPWLGNPSEQRRALSKMLVVDDEVAPTDQVEDGGEGGFDPVFLSADRADVDWNSFSDAEFRKGVRAFFGLRYPQEFRALQALDADQTRHWTKIVAKKGWLAPAWPREHGGMDLSPAKQVIFMEEREASGVLRPAEMGMYMLGPVLMRYGTDEQKAKYLPPIVNGDWWWCQGYSEPNSGSDLASLQTEAVLDGDEYVINGSKIWTSGGHHADHMFMLVRTDKTVKKQEGISFILVDLASPGVTRRPIRNLAGKEEFAQEFFDNVRVPKENLLGGLNKGWTVAKALLGFERLGVGSPRRVQKPLRNVRNIARANGIFDAPEFRMRYTQLHLDVLDLGSIYNHFAAIVQGGGSPGPEISMMKIWAGETTQRITEFAIELSGSAGNIRSPQAFGDVEIDLLGPYYTLFSSTIAGGSNDIQRNILSARVLELPKG
ncbi:acyl-CoA dehydrogenase [Corticibacterium sp. UT-5YL-CI-8]|nr:acyl-CoA dehydrogenase [Tianweitania sp. UT-5YL-CI-8]